MDNIREDTSKQYRAIRKLLHGNIPSRDDDPKGFNWQAVIIGIVCLLAAIYLLCLPGCAYGYTVEQYANAIYKAEGGAKTRHPYGVLGHWHKSPRSICINTIKHQHRLWLESGRKMAFTAFLGRTYCPVGANNDNGTNKYWVRNVNLFLMKGANL